MLAKGARTVPTASAARRRRAAAWAVVCRPATAMAATTTWCVLSRRRAVQSPSRRRVCAVVFLRFSCFAPAHAPGRRRPTAMAGDGVYRVSMPHQPGACAAVQRDCTKHARARTRAVVARLPRDFSCLAPARAHLLFRVAQCDRDVAVVGAVLLVADVVRQRGRGAVDLDGRRRVQRPRVPAASRLARLDQRQLGRLAFERPSLVRFSFSLALSRRRDVFLRAPASHAGIDLYTSGNKRVQAVDNGVVVRRLLLFRRRCVCV